MMMNKRERRKEAVKRLEILWKKGMMSAAKDMFVKLDKIPVFERTHVGGMITGILFDLDEISKDKLYKEYNIKEKVAQFEEAYNATVYLATIESTDFGLLMDLFYVSQYVDEWAQDRYELNDNYSCVRCLNLTTDWCSEFGSIMYGIRFGAVIREG